MNRKALDPNLASILDSIRATVGNDSAPEAHALDTDERTLTESYSPVATTQTLAAEAAVAMVGQLKATANAQAEATVTEGGNRTIEAFVADLLRPQLQAWLDANLPELIQKMAAAEIERLINSK